MRRRLGPTEKEIAFIEQYTEHGDATLAAVQAGYSEHSSQVIGSQLKKKLKTEIDAKLTDKMTADCVLARSVIVKLAKEAQSEDTRLKAAKDIMDRGGRPASKEIVSIKEKRDPAEMLAKLRDQLGDEVADKLAEEYMPINTHEAPEVEQ
jgi:phage terminase small subunit